MIPLAGVMKFLSLTVKAAVALFVCAFAQPLIASTCDEISISQTCLLQSAESTLADIDEPFSWSTAALELAIAYDDSGKTDRAWEYLGLVQVRVQEIQDKEKRSSAIADIASTLSHVKNNPKALTIINAIKGYLVGVEPIEKRQDILGKLATALSVHGDQDAALSDATNLPEGNFTLDSYKARTFREIAVKVAQKGNFTKAIATLDRITMGLPYYRSTAFSDVAAEAISVGKRDLVIFLLDEANTIARSQDNGYFVAGALRDIGFVYAKYGDMKRAHTYFEDALEGASNAETFQEKARSTSRIATRMADAKIYSGSEAIIREAKRFAEMEQSEIFKSYSFYEIAGSAAFCGLFESSRSLIKDIPAIPFSSSASLQDAATRDLAWGLAKHGDLDAAVRTANTIKTGREKIQALSRIVRILNNPDMKALPRYL